MTLEQVEARLAALETEVAQLKVRVGEDGNRLWWKRWVGAFRGDPHYEEALRIGRKYRETLRPKPKGKARKKNK